MNEANMGTTDTLMGVSIDVSATIVNRPNNYDGFKPAVIPHKILCDKMISHLVDICYQDYKKKEDDEMQDVPAVADGRLFHDDAPV